MYQSDSFMIRERKKRQIFQPNVISAFSILVDEGYFHYCDEDERDAYSENTIALIRCISGTGKLFLKNSRVVLKKDEFIFIPFNEIKEYKSLSPIWNYRWVNFTVDTGPIEFTLMKKYNRRVNEAEEKIFVQLMNFGKADNVNHNYINALFLNYFYSLILDDFESVSGVSVNNNKRLIDEMCSFIQQKVYSKISIEELSVFFKVSSRRVHQIFTKEMNISPKQYILRKKMEEGYKLLVQTSMPVNKIADMLCFSSPYHFTNEFKKTFNQTPTFVRNMERL